METFILTRLNLHHTLDSFSQCRRYHFRTIDMDMHSGSMSERMRPYSCHMFFLLQIQSGWFTLFFTGWGNQSQARTCSKQSFRDGYDLTSMIGNNFATAAKMKFSRTIPCYDLKNPVALSGLLGFRFILFFCGCIKVFKGRLEVFKCRSFFWVVLPTF